MIPQPGTNGAAPHKAKATASSLRAFAGRRIRNYRGQSYGRWLAHPAFREGRFTRWDIQAMETDHAIALGLATINSPLFSAQWEVVANSPAVKRFVEDTLRRFWIHDLPKVLQYLPYGSACAEVLYEQDDDTGLWKYAGLDDFELLDVQPLRRGRRLTGARVAYGTALLTGGWDPQQAVERVHSDGMHTDAGDDMREWNLLRPPKLFWCAHRAVYGRIFGRSVLEAAWNPWMEKCAAHGAISIRKLWAFKNAFSSGLILYPPGGTQLDTNGNLLDNQDLAREIGEKMDTGAVLTCPSEVDEHGNRTWDVVKPTINGDIHQLLEYPEKLDVSIWQGMGICDEILKAGETGGGWSGRSVPLLIFLNMGDVRVREIITAFDVGPSGYTTRSEQVGGVIRPLVLENFGPKAKYEIRPASLVPKPMPANGAGMPGEGKPRGGGDAPPGAAPPPPPAAMGAGSGGNPAAIMGAPGMQQQPLKLSQADADSSLPRELPDAEVEIALSQANDVSSEARDEGGQWTHGARANALAPKHAEFAEKKAALQKAIAEYKAALESKINRAANGEFGSGGGIGKTHKISPDDLHPTEDEQIHTGRVAKDFPDTADMPPANRWAVAKEPLQAVVKTLQQVGHKASEVEHAAKQYVADKIEAGVSRCPPKLQAALRASFFVGKLGLHGIFAGYTVAQHLAEHVARERGMDDEQARRFRGVLSRIDLGTFEVFKVGTLAGIHAAHAPAIATGLVPVASAGYLMYATARDPLAVLKGAWKAVKSAGAAVRDMAGGGMGGSGIGLAQADPRQANATAIADALQQHGYDDAYIAILSAALDQTKNGAAAIALANRLHGPAQLSQAQLDKLPAPLRAPVRAALASVEPDASAIAAAAEAHGLDDAQRRSLHAACATWEQGGAGVSLSTGATVPGLVPAASLLYLGFSTARDPVATWRAAVKAVALE